MRSVDLFPFLFLSSQILSSSQIRPSREVSKERKAKSVALSCQSGKETQHKRKFISVFLSVFDLFGSHDLGAQAVSLAATSCTNNQKTASCGSQTQLGHDAKLSNLATKTALSECMASTRRAKKEDE